MMKMQSKEISVWSMIRRVLPQIATACLPLFILTSVLFVCDGALYASSIWLMQSLFDKATALATSTGTLKEAVFALMLVFAVEVLKQVISGLDNFIGEMNDLLITGTLTHKVNVKMSKLDPICFENPTLLDHINKCYSGIRVSIHFVNTIMDTVTFYVPYFILIGIYLFSLKPILAISILFIFLPVLFTQIMNAKIFSKLEDESAPIRRKSKYYESCLTDREYVKETRILGACPYFIKLFKATIIEINNLKWKADVKANLLELSTKLVSLAGYLGILLMLFSALMKQEISVGAFAAIFASLGNMFELMEEVICDRLGGCSEDLGKVRNYLMFLDLPERVNDKNVNANNSKDENVSNSVNKYRLIKNQLKTKNYPDEKDSLNKSLDLKNLNYETKIHGDIVLENVTFSYPLSNKNAVENVNLKIHKGETIAIVGENGSGKSTLVRLIIGLYLPSYGKILHNNKSTKDFTQKELFSGISGVFQKYQRYQLSLRDNITISDMENSLDFSNISTISNSCNSNIATHPMISENIEKAAMQGGVEINSEVFPNGYDTMLSREFDGVDLSGGQWQKVAIARGFYRDHELIVLDEPTAAIDPIEETKIYERFAKISKGKTSVVVTHRLGSVKFADRIVVMNSGKIEGVGTHDSLLLTCPLYARMWELQAQYYTSSDLLA